MDTIESLTKELESYNKQAENLSVQLIKEQNTAKNTENVLHEAIGMVKLTSHKLDILKQEEEKKNKEE